VLLRPLPPQLGGLVDGEIRHAIDVQGGIRLTYRVPHDAAAYAEVLAERARRRAGAAEGRVEEGAVVVDILGIHEAPFVPIEVLVPRDRAADARAALERLFDPPPVAVFE